jgi:hypothetical protein
MMFLHDKIYAAGIVAVIVAMCIAMLVLLGCKKRPLPADRMETCRYLGLDPWCEEGLDFCLMKYVSYDPEDREIVWVYEPCD